MRALMPCLVNSDNHLVIVCDANTEVGLGHFSRCFTIAQALMSRNQDLTVSFFGNFNDFAIKKLEKAQISYSQQLPLHRGYSILVDGYQHNEQSLQALAQHGKYLFVIDDFDVYNFACVDLIINFRFGAERLIDNSSKHCLGLTFFPFQPQFIPVRKKRMQTPNREIKQILVVVGGSDRYDVATKLLIALDEVVSGCQITLLGEHPQLPALTHNSIVLHPFVEDMAAYYSSADIVLCGGGLVKYESGFCLVANAALAQTPEQQLDTQILARSQLSYDLGLASELDLNSDVLKVKLKAFLHPEQLQSQFESMRYHYDTDSTHNLVSKILELIHVKT
ncbi:hypothetical protein [Pseudoalteromonas viridis]|uniref:UDP-2,4-diacetamido-2,4, 6-trideoxy-beta-L-altropyranose hydrolase n=1 Tax=Pseudoalteromonas viridis TaxID=339617 RepID=A0ABX7V024_9GAMM|nr:hypothetical protein [Pseudoalteromonas viridis]QTL34229.1 hypothetical protein J5X90_11680 [Pseudoalteromonas viridis]